MYYVEMRKKTLMYVTHFKIAKNKFEIYYLNKFIYKHLKVCFYISLYIHLNLILEIINF